MRLPLLILFLTLGVLCPAAAQTKAERDSALRIALHAITLVDQGELDSGMVLLRQASALDSTRSNYRYEQGYIYEKKGEYATAKDIVEPLLDDTNATDRYYELVGNCYDYLKNPEQAIKYYYAGLKRFPNSGPLHLELGIMAVAQKDYSKAVAIWEEGIDRDPMFPSNYYWAATFYCKSDHKLWGVIYGELFMNIERNSPRTNEISELLYDTYQKAITIRRDTARIDFEPGIAVHKFSAAGKPVIPLIAPYGTTMLLALVEPAKAARKTADRSLSLASLHAIRASFIETWYRMNQQKDYPSVLFDWQRMLMKEGLGEAYDYWLLSQGSPEEFVQWQNKNAATFKRFAARMTGTPIKIDSAHAFNRIRVDERNE